MPVAVVVGTQWGDEGKAKVIDLLARSHEYVVRYQGGHNAGHTVVVGDQRYALQLVPSGVLYDHVTPVIGNGVVVDLPTLFAEIDELERRGISCSRLKVSSLAQLIFPWHQAHDQITETARGDNKIGTTLKGIGPAYADKALRVGIRVGEVRHHERFIATLRQRVMYERELVATLGGPTLDVESIIRQFSELALRLVPYIADTVSMLHDAREKGARILLEGAQATFLDLDHGTYPYVTSSNPTSGGACVGSGLGPRHIDRIIGITKAYTTRVGSGPFPTELTDATGDTIVEIGQEFGTVTGRRRRPGWLDLVMLRHAVRINSLTEVALTKLDVLDSFGTIRLCVGYLTNGEPLVGYPDDIELLGIVEPRYVDMPGWKEPLRNIKTFDDLPQAARDFVLRIEREIQVPVRIVGVGPERDDCVVRS